MYKVTEPYSITVYDGSEMWIVDVYECYESRCVLSEAFDTEIAAANWKNMIEHQIEQGLGWV